MVCLDLSQVVIAERVASAPARFDKFCCPLCKQGVAGSIPATSTNCFADCNALTRFISAQILQFWSHGVNL